MTLLKNELRAQPTRLTEEDLMDTGKTANAPVRSNPGSRKLRFGDLFENSLIYPDLVQQHKQNEEIRKVCELQRVMMARQWAVMKLQRESGKTRSRKNPALESTLTNR